MARRSGHRYATQGPRELNVFMFNKQGNLRKTVSDLRWTKSAMGRLGPECSCCSRCSVVNRKTKTAWEQARNRQLSHPCVPNEDEQTWPEAKAPPSCIDTNRPKLRDAGAGRGPRTTARRGLRRGAPGACARARPPNDSRGCLAACGTWPTEVNHGRKRDNTSERKKDSTPESKRDRKQESRQGKQGITLSQALCL